MSESKLDFYIKIFESLEDSDIYDVVLETGANVETNVDRATANFVHGCQSQVWVIGEDTPLGWNFSMDSDSYMVKGLGNIVCECLSEMTSNELAQVTMGDFSSFAVFFSTQRRQGMQAIINKCKQISKGN